MKFRIITYLFFMSLFFSCSTKEIKIACVGDSITEGAGIKFQSKSSYPVELNKILGHGYTVENFGRSATTMNKQGDFPYWIAKEFSNVFSFKPDIIIIQLGTNDTKPYNWDAKSFKTSYQAMIDTFSTIQPKPEIYLCKPVPVMESNWGINDSTLTNGVIPMVEELAKINQLETINLYVGLKDYPDLFPDGIHPNEEGAHQMAKIIAKEILQ